MTCLTKKALPPFHDFLYFSCVFFFPFFFSSLGKDYDVVANIITQSEFQFQCLNACNHDSYIAVLAFPSAQCAPQDSVVFLFDAYINDHKSNYFVKTCLPTSVMFSFVPGKQAAKIMVKINRSITCPLFWSMCIKSRFDSDCHSQNERVIFFQSLLDIEWGRHHLVSIPTLLIFLSGLCLFARLKFKIQVLLSAKWVLACLVVCSLIHHHPLGLG